MSETKTLTGPLLKMYEQAGALAFRMQSGQIPIGKRWIHLCKEGTADILLFPRSGGIVWVETKDPEGKTHKARKMAQEAFRDRVEALGHRYLRVTTIDDGLIALQG
jgi:hypothetical protein